jgi:hypothetical protein
MKLSVFFGVAASLFVVASASAKPAVDVEALERRGNLDGKEKVYHYTYEEILLIS